MEKITNGLLQRAISERIVRALSLETSSKNDLDTRCKGFISMEDCKNRANCDMLFECEDYLQAERLNHEERVRAQTFEDADIS